VTLRVRVRVTLRVRVRVTLRVRVRVTLRVRVRVTLRVRVRVRVRVTTLMPQQQSGVEGQAPIQRIAAALKRIHSKGKNCPDHLSSTAQHACRRPPFKAARPTHPSRYMDPLVADVPSPSPAPFALPLTSGRPDPHPLTPSNHRDIASLTRPDRLPRPPFPQNSPPPSAHPPASPNTELIIMSSTA